MWRVLDSVETSMLESNLNNLQQSGYDIFKLEAIEEELPGFYGGKVTRWTVIAVKY